MFNQEELRWTDLVTSVTVQLQVRMEMVWTTTEPGNC
jgi:hypothetical protein